MTEFCPVPDLPLGLSSIVDVYDCEDLLESLDNFRVVELSRMGGTAGFAGVDNVLKSTGISVRRILREGCTAVHLGVALCQKLRQETGLTLQDFSAVLLCHSHTDPAECGQLAEALCDQLHLPGSLIQGYNFGCGGFLKLLHEGVMHLAGDNQASNVLLLNIETPETWHDASDRLFCGIVGAGATAVVIERGRGIPISVVRSDDFPVPVQLRHNSDPLFRRETADVFSFRGSPVHRTVMRMNAEPVFLNGIELMLSNLRTAVSSIDIMPGQRVVVVPHQPSGKLLKALVAAAKTEFPRFEFLNNLKAFGNTISSSVPTILSRLPDVLAANKYEPLRDGDHIILLVAGICMEEMGDHMSAGHACLQWVSVRSEVVTSKDRELASETCRAITEIRL